MAARNRYYSGPPSDHFDGIRFFNPGIPVDDKGLTDILKWKLRERAALWPKRIPAGTGVRPDARVDGLRVTHIGHSAYLLQIARQNILLDPVWSERVSPLNWAGPSRHNAPGVNFDDLPPIDTVLVTHSHYDHMDTATLARLWQAHRPRILMPLGNDTILRRSIPGVEVEIGDWWQEFTFESGIGVTILPAYHWSSRTTSDRRMALWGGFAVQTASATVYCAGDTAYRDGAIFRQIRERVGPVQLAMLPIGAYAPRWFMRTQHADPQEAVRIAQDVSATQVLGVHWGTFQLTDEAWDEPAQRLREASTGTASIRFQALRPGDVWDTDAEVPGLR